MDNTINFSLTVEETNIIFKALGKMPFEDVYELIGKLNEQANQQLGAEGKSFQTDKS